MGICNHMWEFEPGQGYNPNSNSKSYKCTLCGAVTTDNAIVEKLVYQIKRMRDGAESTIGEMLSPEKYGYTELAHICMMVTARAKAEGILLDTGDSSNVFLQYYDRFKKRERKHIVIKQVFPKGTDGYYDHGASEVETTEVFVFDRVQVKYSLLFCCDKRMQTQQTFTNDYYYNITRDHALSLIDWCSRVAANNKEYDMTNKTVTAPEHFGHSIITINNESYLLKSDDPMIKDLETLVELESRKVDVEERRKKFIGVGIAVEKEPKAVEVSDGKGLGGFFSKLKDILTKPL